MTSTIQGNPVSPTAPAEGQTYVMTSGVLTPSTPNPGDITEVTVTAPITGGGAGGSVNIGVNDFTGDSGAGGVRGTVPAPDAGDAAAGKFLGAGGAWAVPGGGGAITTLASITDPNSVSAIVNTEVDIISSGAVACSAGKSQMVIFDCDYYADANAHGDNWFRLYADATQIAGKSARHYVSGVPFVFPVTIVAIVTGLPAGNHTFKATVRMSAGGGGETANTNSFFSADTATRLVVIEF